MKIFFNKKNLSFFKILWDIISLKRKKQIFICLQLIIINGILDLVSITSILPLLYFLTSDPESIMEWDFVRVTSQILNINNSDQLIVIVDSLCKYV